MRTLALLCLLTACGDVNASTDADLDGGHDAALDATPDGSRDAGEDAADDDAGARDPLRIADRSIVAWLRADRADPWWIEERIAPWPRVEGDRDPGRRAIVHDGTEVYAPGDDERLIDACLHASGQWTAVGVDAARRPFLVRGDHAGAIARAILDDPELAEDPRAWIETPSDTLRVGALSEASPSVDADGDDAVVALMSESHAILLHRWEFTEGAFVRGARALLSPARVATPFLPIGASYDNFDAVVAPYLVHLAVAPMGSAHEGRAFVVALADRGRIDRHNALMGTDLALLRSGPGEHPSDALVFGVDRDGSVRFTVVAGTVDREDEPFGIAASRERVAIVGRTRREPGRDNTELHAFIAQIDHQGRVLAAGTWDGARSALAQVAAFAPDGSLWVGGTHDWTQNPTGISLYEPGTPFLLAASAEGWIDRSATLATTRGHAELRALAVGDDVAAGGLENGPLTHTGDSDPSRIRSDAWASWSAR